MHVRVCRPETVRALRPRLRGRYPDLRGSPPVLPGAHPDVQTELLPIPDRPAATLPQVRRHLLASRTRADRTRLCLVHRLALCQLGPLFPGLPRGPRLLRHPALYRRHLLDKPD